MTWVLTVPCPMNNTLPISSIWTALRQLAEHFLLSGSEVVQTQHRPDAGLAVQTGIARSAIGVSPSRATHHRQRPHVPPRTSSAGGSVLSMNPLASCCVGRCLRVTRATSANARSPAVGPRPETRAERTGDQGSDEGHGDRRGEAEQQGPGHGHPVGGAAAAHGGVRPSLEAVGSERLPIAHLVRVADAAHTPAVGELPRGEHGCTRPIRQIRSAAVSMTTAPMLETA